MGQSNIADSLSISRDHTSHNQHPHTQVVKSSANVPSCCGLCSIQYISVVFIAIDILLVSHALTFTLINYVSGEVKYLEVHNVVTVIIEYYMLMPLLVVQISWMAAALLALISIKMNIPYLQLPYLAICGCVTVVLVLLVLKSVTNYQNGNKSIDFIVTIVVLNVILICHVIFWYLKCFCFRIMLRKRNTVTSSEKQNKMIISAVDAQFDTYSTRSTVIMTDDFYQCPPSP